VLELGDRTEDLEQHASNDGGGVDALVEYHQVHPSGFQVVRDDGPVPRGSLLGCLQPADLSLFGQRLRCCTRAVLAFVGSGARGHGAGQASPHYRTEYVPSSLPTGIG
jgi:hypothetical protein